VTSRFKFLRLASGKIGAALLLFALFVAFVGPLLAPHPPDATIGLPLAGPSGTDLLGTDELGRDVLSRVLHGGASVVLLALAATLIAYAIGLLIGLVAGYRRGLIDPVLMRGVDVMLSLPPLLFLLVLVTATGTSVATLIIGVAIVQAPGIARLVRTVTLEASVRGYVEAAVARGESTAAILRREILPNIVPAIIADAGLRFTFSVLLIAAANFLTIGLQPPSSDWGLMISLNRQYISINPWSVAAPAVMIICLTVGINLIGDAIGRSMGRSRAAGWSR
jgi:peptide/nickel transport system permease protein